MHMHVCTQTRTKGNRSEVLYFLDGMRRASHFSTCKIALLLLPLASQWPIPPTLPSLHCCTRYATQVFYTSSLRLCAYMHIMCTRDAGHLHV